MPFSHPPYQRFPVCRPVNRAPMTALLGMAFLFEIQCDYLKTSNNTHRPALCRRTFQSQAAPYRQSGHHP
jgi:hypothetical protein